MSTKRIMGTNGTARAYKRWPEALKREIVAATVGLVPQVVTETLYALVRHETEPFVPDEIHVITTVEGRERTRLMLLDPTRAVLARFADEYELPSLAGALTLDRIHVISDEAGRPLSDISTEAVNQGTADLINRLIRELTSDPAAALHVSITGGRKTMGFFLGAALSLYGRMQDRLSHVLVEPAAFEQHPEFFYPPRVPRVLQDLREKNKPLDTRSARVTLAEIPFVRLRNGLPQKLLDGDWSYSETVRRAQGLAREPRLVLDRRDHLVSCGGTIFKLSAATFAYYAWLAERRIMLGDKGSVSSLETSPKEMYRGLTETFGLTERSREALRTYVDDGRIPEEALQTRKNRVNEALTLLLGQDDTPYHVALLGYIAGTQFERQGLRLEPGQITFEALAIATDEDE